MRNADLIAFALIDLESYVISNYITTTIKHKIVHIILMRWYMIKMISNYGATRDHHQTLNKSTKNELQEYMK